MADRRIAEKLCLVHPLACGVVEVASELGSCPHITKERSAYTTAMGMEMTAKMNRSPARKKQ
jgi:hypothetical protein